MNMLVRPATLLFISILTVGCTTGSSTSQATPPSTDSDAFTVTLSEHDTIAVLDFPAGSELNENRGVSWRLERWNGEAWNPEWILAGGAYTVQEWADSNLAVGGVGLFGAGPDEVPLPELDHAQLYRLCHGLDAETTPVGCAAVPLGSEAPDDKTDITETTASEQSSSDAAAVPDAQAPGRCPPGQQLGRDASEYLGTSEDEAKKLAADADLKLIVECRDGEVSTTPRATNIDYTRLWLSIDEGIVTSAYRL
jgi:hypothetical protein